SKLSQLEDKQRTLKHHLINGLVNYRKTYLSPSSSSVGRMVRSGKPSVISKISIYISLILVHHPKGDSRSIPMAFYEETCYQKKWISTLFHRTIFLKSYSEETTYLESL